MSDASIDTWLTADAAAEILGVSKRQAQRLCEDGDVRIQRQRRPFLYHEQDVHALAAERAATATRDIDSTYDVSRPNEWKARYDQANQELHSAAHTIGQLEERVRQTEEQLKARPLLEDHATLKAERDAAIAESERLRTALERAQRPWWRRWFTT